MSYSKLLYTFENGVGLITLNRPEALNALDAQMRAELRDAIGRATAEARVLVLTGAGRAFCAGQDLGSGQSLAQSDLERLLREEYAPLITAIATCPLPTIAAVNGVAAGAGASLALATDVVIATESARFIQAFTRIGLIPDAGGTHALPRRVGTARAMGAMLFGEAVSARQAAEWGMIWEAVPDEGFTPHWQARAAQLASGPARAYRALKEALRASPGNDLESQMQLEAHLQGDCARSEDFREGVLAFLEKRPPDFSGR